MSRIRLRVQTGQTARSTLTLAVVVLLTGCGSFHVQVETSSDIQPPGGGTVEVSAPVTPPTPGYLSSSEEVCAVREAIVTALRNADADSTPWASEVIGRTDGAPCVLEDDGVARIGNWTLAPCTEGCEETPMRFVFREDGSQLPTYAAEIVRDATSGFRCTNLGQFMAIPSGS